MSGASQLAAVDVATLRATLQPVGDGAGDSAVLLDGGTLAIAGPGGVHALDVRGSRPRGLWRERRGRSVAGSDRTAIAIDATSARARDAASGRVLWRARGRFFSVTAAYGRAYLGTPRRLQIRDLRSGRVIGERPPVLTRIRFVDE